MTMLIALMRFQTTTFSGLPFVTNPGFAYPLVAALVAVSLVFCVAGALRETRADQRKGDTFASALTSNGVAAVVYLLIELVMIGVIGLAFATNPTRLPFIAPPASGGLWATPYLTAAVILHAAVGYLMLLALIGTWLAQVGVISSSRYFALAIIVVSVVVIAGWETQRLPLWYLVYAEALVVAATGDPLISALFPSETKRPGLLRAQNALAIIFLAVGVVVIWLAHRLPLPYTALGPLTRAPNPTLYAIALIAMALCLVLACLYILTNPQPRRISLGVPSNPGPQTLLNAIGLEIPAVYFLWLTFVAAPTSLPFPPPAAGGVWLWVLPAQATYTTLALLLHGVASFLLIQLIFGFWLGSLSVRNGSRLFQFGILLSFVVMALGWETQHWPVVFLVPAEGVLAFFVYTTLSGLFDKGFESRVFDNPLAFRRARRLAVVVEYLAVMAALAFILFAHDIAYFAVNLFLLYLALVFLDPIAANIASAIHPQNSGTMLLSPQRWQFTLLITLPLILLGASGLFMSFSANSGLTFDLWIEGGMAAALYLLFNPLIDLARYVGGKRATQPGDLDLAELIQGLISGTAILGQRRANRTAAANPTASDQADAEPPDEPLITARDKAALATIERQVAEQLKFPTGVIFLLAALAYHLLITLFNFSSIFDSSLVPLVFGLVGLVAALLPLVNNKALETTRYISLLLLFVTIVVTGISVLFTVNPQPHAVSLAGQSAMQLLTNQTFYTTALRLALQEALFLLTIGQLGYLYRVINANITFEQDLAKDPDTDGWDELAEDTYTKGNLDKALIAYRKAFDSNPDNLWLLRRQGFIFEAQSKYAEALAIYEDLIARKPKETSYWSDKGDALAGLGRTADALAAYQQGVALDAANAFAWNGEGSALMALGRPAEAYEAYAHATDLAPDNALFWVRKGVALAALKRTDEAIAAYDRAIKIDANRAIAWFCKGELLLQMERYQEAHDLLAKGFALDSAFAPGWFDDGAALLNLGRTEEALAAFAQAATLDPTNSNALNGKGRALYNLGRYAEALDAYKAALAIAPDTAMYLDNQGDALLALGLADEALAAYEAALSREPENTIYLQDKANALRRLGRDDEAAEAEARAKTLAPTLPAPRA